MGTLLVIVMAVWALGLATSHTFGGLIHLLLLVAMVMVLIIGVFQRRRPLGS